MRLAPWLGPATAVLFAAPSASATDGIAIERFNAYGTYAVAVAPNGDVVVSGSADTLDDRRPFVLRADDRVDRIDTPKRAAVLAIAYSDDGAFRWLGVSSASEESGTSYVECTGKGQTRRHPHALPSALSVGTNGEALVWSEVGVDRFDCDRGATGQHIAGGRGLFLDVAWRPGGAAGFLSTFDSARSRSRSRWVRPTLFTATWSDGVDVAEPVPTPVALPSGFGTPAGDHDARRDEQPPIAPDGMGGAWGIADRELVHVEADGAVHRLAPETAKALGDASRFRLLAWDPVRKEVVAAGADPGASLPSELVAVSPGHVRRSRIAWPDHLSHASGLRLAARGGIVAVSVDGALIRWRSDTGTGGAETTLFYDGQARASAERDVASERSHSAANVAAVVLGGAAGLAGGAAIAATPDNARYSRTLAESASGSIVGIPGNALVMLGGQGLFASEYSSHTTGGMIARGVGGAALLFGAAIGPPLTAAGSYATSEWGYRGNPDASFANALGGAYLGAGIGLATHILVSKLTRSEVIRYFSLSTSTMFVGTMSSWAIHNAGDGAR